MENRAEHLEWCKQRALRYVERGDYLGAFTSFQSDMGKHPETQNHMVLQMGTMLMLGGLLSSEKGVRDWITGAN